MGTIMIVVATIIKRQNAGNYRRRCSVSLLLSFLFHL